VLERAAVVLNAVVVVVRTALLGGEAVARADVLVGDVLVRAAAAAAVVRIGCSSEVANDVVRGVAEEVVTTAGRAAVAVAGLAGLTALAVVAAFTQAAW
jgi:hypothetical protein